MKLKKFFSWFIAMALCMTLFSSISPISSNAASPSKGIDVSTHNGKIDWAKVKASGIEYAIIRCGYGDNIYSQDDNQFANNVAGCVANGIPYAVYFYSYAVNDTGDESVESEIAHAKRLLSGKNPFCVYYDMEDSSTAHLSKTTLTNYAVKFCEALKSSGYKVGVYANTNWFDNYLDSYKLYNNGYSLWVADYRGYCGYKKTGFDIWQYSSTGTCNGISGNVDMNYMYNQPANIPTPTQAPSNSAKINVTYQVYDLDLLKWLPNVTDTQDCAGVFGDAVTSVYANLSSGNITYKVHVKDSDWLPEVTNRSDYAGILSKPIDGLMIKTDTGRTVKYRVHTLGGQWLPYVTGYNQNDSSNGFAGIYGQTIDAIQIYVEDPATPVQKPGIIADGTYYLSPKCATSSVMDVVNGSYTGAIQLYSKADVPAQKFSLKHLGNDYYTITCCTGKLLNGGSQQSTKITQETSNGSNAQKWLIKASGDGDYFNICSGANTALCIDVINGWSANGTRIQLYQNVNVNAQKWKFIPIAETAMFPVSSRLNVNTIAYEYGPGGARHNGSNAIDCLAASTSEYALAPFTGTIVAVANNSYNDCNAIWFQSNEKVYYADGTYDHMTVLMLHGSGSYSVGTEYRQGEKLYRMGDSGSSGAYHFHFEVIKGKGAGWSCRGNVFAYNAFYVKSGTPVISQGKLYSGNWLSGAPAGTPTDWTGKWKFKN